MYTLFMQIDSILSLTLISTHLDILILTSFILQACLILVNYNVNKKEEEVEKKIKRDTIIRKRKRRKRGKSKRRRIKSMIGGRVNMRPCSRSKEGEDAGHVNLTLLKIGAGEAEVQVRN